MMIRNVRNKNIEINFDKVTQIVNFDLDLSNDIFLYITNYFSSNKFSEDELLLFGGDTPEIQINDKEISRTKYNCISISSIRDIDEVIKHKKDTLTMRYCKYKLGTLELQREIDDLQRQFLNIVEKISGSFDKEDIIKISDIELSAEYLLSKNITSYISMEYSYYEKIKQLVRILIFNEDKNTDEYLLYLHNVDTYFKKYELENLVDMCQNHYNINIILSYTNTNYIIMNNLEKVNFLYEDDVVELPEIQTILDKLNEHNISLREFSMSELIIFLQDNIKSLVENKFNDSKYYNDIFKTIMKQVNREYRDIIELENCIRI